MAYLGPFLAGAFALVAAIAWLVALSGTSSIAWPIAIASTAVAVVGFKAGLQ